MDDRSRMNGVGAQDSLPDAVGGMLAEIRVAAASIAQFALGGPWSIALGGVPSLFLVTEGEAWLHAPGDVPQMLRPGDSLLALRGDLVRLASGPRVAQFASMDEIWAANGGAPISFEGYRVPLEVRWGAPGASCRMIGFAMTLSRMAGSAALARAVPKLIVQRGDGGAGPWTGALESMLARERSRPSPGFIAYGGTLSQLLLIDLLRAFLAGREGATAFGTGSAQSGLARVIRNLHVEPGRRWTVAAMALEAGMSRTSFIAHFIARTGMTPFEYLRQCRIEQAAMALQTGMQPVADIAARCGYRSERAFRAAFHRRYGVAPLAFRRLRTRTGASVPRQIGET